MPSIFLVSKGSYSDYHIEKAFSTKEFAEQWLSDTKDPEKDRYAADYDSYHIEEREVDDFSNKPYLGYSVTMNYETGDVFEVARSSIEDYDKYVNLCEPSRWSDSPKVVHIYLKVKTQDQATAIKVANEKRCQMKAFGHTEFGGYDKETLQMDHKTT